MAANGRGMMRPNAGGRSPPFVVIGLVVVSVILGFNYWRLSSRNTELNDQLLDLQDKLRITTLKKLSVEKRNDVCVQKIKESDSEKDRHKTSFDQCEMEKRSCRDQVASKGREYESQRIAVEECKRDLVGFPSIARLHRDLNIPVHSVQLQLTFTMRYQMWFIFLPLLPPSMLCTHLKAACHPTTPLLNWNHTHPLSKGHIVTIRIHFHRCSIQHRGN